MDVHLLGPDTRGLKYLGGKLSAQI